MVKLYPVMPLVPVADPSTPSALKPNRFRSQAYDRPFGSDDCTKHLGKCGCFMCCDTPVVIAACGDPICERFNITLRNLQEYVDGNLLKVQHKEALIIYRQRKSDGSYMVGIFAAIEVADYSKRIIRPHENVTAKTDVTVLNKAKCHSSSCMDPVVLLHREDSNINAIIEKIMQEEKPFQASKSEYSEPDESDISTDTESSFWMVRNAEDVCTIQKAFASIENLYIADGHHRTAACCKECAKLSCDHSSKALTNVACSSRFLTALIFPDTHLNVLSYNRCIRYLPKDMSTTDLLNRLAEAFDVKPIKQHYYECDDDMRIHTVSIEVPHMFSNQVGRSNPFSLLNPSVIAVQYSEPKVEPVSAISAPLDQRVLHMYLDKQWYALSALNLSSGLMDNPVSEIGCYILQENIALPIFGVNNPLFDNSMIYVDGKEGAHGVETLVDSGAAAVGFMVCPVPTSAVMRVADAGQLLPAKATFFDPKPMPNFLQRLLK